MEIYLVGGAIRDKLLGEPVKERDWVVVGAAPEEMLELGYYQVGKGFPVFLHPKTHEEYALARIERKTGKGYTQFTCLSSPDVSLEEDLKRRDLTINAMAETIDGKLIDPYGGQEDLKKRILRHVSAAFAEDPLRILRVARFAARFGDFQVHPETMSLMKKIVSAREVETLVPERVWQELHRSLLEKYPWRFFQVLKECAALHIVFPEIERSFIKALTALKNARRLSPQAEVRYAAVLYNCDPASAAALCERLRSPRSFKELAVLVIKNKQDFQRALELNAEKLLALLDRLDISRRGRRFHGFLLACESNSASIPSAQLQRLKKAYDRTVKVSIKRLFAQGLRGEELKKAIHDAKLEVLNAFG